MGLQKVSPNPKTLLKAALLALTIAMAGCASTTLHAESDSMCQEIADFANASQDRSPHEVRLITDWGGSTCSTPDEPSIFCKSCIHDGYAPGKLLCDYLMEHTATEFAQVNLARALSCLNLGYGHLTLGPKLNALANRKIWSTRAAGVTRGITVGAEFQTPPPEGNYIPPTLILVAQRNRTP